MYKLLQLWLASAGEALVFTRIIGTRFYRTKELIPVAKETHKNQYSGELMVWLAALVRTARHISRCTVRKTGTRKGSQLLSSPCFWVKINAYIDTHPAHNLRFHCAP